LVLAGHEDGTAQLWDVATSRPLGAPVVGVLPVRGVAFAPDGRSFLTVGGNGAVRHWPVPDPLEGDAEELVRSLQLTTGLRMDATQSVVALTRQEWEDEHRQWCQRQGSRPWGLGQSVADADWHEARSRDAEEAGAAFTARWHLERLISLHPDDWLLYARRARTYTDEESWDLAEADYRRACAGGAGDALLDWFRFQTWFCHHRGQAAAGRWYQEYVGQELPKR
jgi:WD40 repeat protein